MTGCSQKPTAQPVTLPTATLNPTQTSIPSPTARPSVTPTVEIAISNSATLYSGPCSPLEGLTLADLPEIVSNPFQPPRAGSDEGHHGIDFAFYRYREKGSINSWTVQAVFPGKIAAAIKDRPPYGNFMIIESPLDELPKEAQDFAFNEPLEISPTPVTPLTCPVKPEEPLLGNTGEAMYLLYAHLQSPPAFRTGQEVTCGSEIGKVGNTGFSGNPHLHLEARLGPAGMRFTEMAHYVASATNLEMANYCLWRVSGKFQMIDPGKILFETAN
jgi:murein DD-endopeptidase MepM/ murein hydrolase activator NlpD